MDLPEELRALQRFHGHLGIYVTLGLRMGTIGQRMFGHWKGLRATVRTVPEPPMMCLADGVQVGSACTMGKGNISLEPATEPSVTFEKDGRRLTISLRPGFREKVDSEMSHETELERSRFYFTVPEEEIFDLSEA